jgi:hypothetical protein
LTLLHGPPLPFLRHRLILHRLANYGPIVEGRIILRLALHVVVMDAMVVVVVVVVDVVAPDEVVFMMMMMLMMMMKE